MAGGKYVHLALVVLQPRLRVRKLLLQLRKAFTLRRCAAAQQVIQQGCALRLGFSRFRILFVFIRCRRISSIVRRGALLCGRLRGRIGNGGFLRCLGRRSGFFCGFGRSGGFLRRFRRSGNLRRRFGCSSGLRLLHCGDAGGEIVHLAPGRIAVGDGGFQLGTHIRKLRFVRGNFRFQPVDGLLQGTGVQQLQILDILLLSGLQRGLLLPFLLGVLQAGEQRVAGFAAQAVQLLLQLLALKLQSAQRVRHLGNLRLFFIAEVHQSLQLGKRGLRSLQLRVQLRPLGSEGFDGHGHLLGARFDGSQRLVNLGVGLLPSAGELALAGGQLVHGVAQLQLHLGKLLVHLGEYGVVERIDAVLLDGDIHLLGQYTAGGDAGNAVHRFIFGDQLILHIIGELQQIRVLQGHGGNGDRQHIRIQLHNHRRADGIIPAAGEQLHLGVDFDHGGIHIRAGFKLHHHQRKVFAGRGGQALHIRERGKGRLHGAGDLGFHLFRGGAGIACIDDDVRQIHTGQQIAGHMRK